MLSNFTEDNPVTVQSTAEETTVTTLEPPVEETTVTTLDPNSALQNAQPTHPPEFLSRDDNINEGRISRLKCLVLKICLELDSCSLDSNINRKRRNDIDGRDVTEAGLTSRIVNGIAAADNSWPWLARLAFQTRSQHSSNSYHFRIEIIYAR